MARVWIAYREGLRLLGAPITTVPLPSAVPRLDLAPWRLFTVAPPEETSMDEALRVPTRKRVLVEVGDDDRYDLCGLGRGFFESPYSLEECRRRLNLS